MNTTTSNGLSGRAATSLSFLEDAVAANDVVVFTTSFGCESIRTKAFFEQPEFKALDLRFYDMDTLPNAKALLHMLSGNPTIFIHGKRMQDMDEVIDGWENGEILQDCHLAQ